MTVLEPVINFILTCKGKKVSLDQVMVGAERPRKPTLRVMDRLVREGYLVEIADNKIRRVPAVGGRQPRNPVWKIIRPPQPPCIKAKRRTSRDRIWQAIRMKRRFTRSEIRAITCASEGSIQDLVILLEREGYLRMIGRAATAKVYLLIKDVGPQRPHIPELTRRKPQEAHHE